MDKFYNRVVLDALENQHLLSEWESGFIDSMAEKDEDYEPSDKQKDILKRIEHKIALG